MAAPWCHAKLSKKFVNVISDRFYQFFNNFPSALLDDAPKGHPNPEFSPNNTSPNNEPLNISATVKSSAGDNEIFAWNMDSGILDDNTKGVKENKVVTPPNFEMFERKASGSQAPPPPPVVENRKSSSPTNPGGDGWGQLPPVSGGGFNAGAFGVDKNNNDLQKVGGGIGLDDQHARQANDGRKLEKSENVLFSLD